LSNNPSIAVVSATGTSVAGSAPVTVIGFPNGAANPPANWSSTVTTLMTSQIPALQPNTLYRVQFGVTFATSGPCAGTSWATLGSFTTGAS
jgi:hypothetical protein